MAYQEFTFENGSQLCDVFSQRIKQNLNDAIAQKGHATLAVSGGNTPKPLFEKLSNDGSVEWSKVTVLLVDERWVTDDSSASNQTLVKEHLLQNYAQEASYLSIKNMDKSIEETIPEVAEAIAKHLPLDVIVLGMGSDAHTASLFPCSAELADGLDLNNNAVVLSTTPTTAPHKRVSLTLKSIVDAANVYLHITGSEKLSVFKDAIENYDEMIKPIGAVAKNTTLNLMWAP